MKKIILSFIALVACGLVANAATKYQINVAGVEVTSDNASYISGGDITNGYGVYDASSNTLTLYNITISRTTSGDYALHNRDCFELKVKFVGACNLTSTKARAIRFDNNGSLEATSGSTVNVTGQNDGAVYVCKHSVIKFYGPGTFNIKSTSKKGAIQGNLSGTPASYEDVHFSSNVNATIESPESPLYDFNYVEFEDSCNVTLKATGNSSYPVVRNVKNVTFSSSSTSVQEPAILAPYGAYFSSSAKSIVSSSGSSIYNQDIFISNDYVAIFNSSYFPDASFRTALLNLYPKGYITTSDVNSRTNLDVSGYGIADLTGVNYFSKLTKLSCYNNLLTTLPSLPSTIQELYCSNNKFTQLVISHYKSLRYINISNNTSLTSLLCNDDALTGIDLSGCTALTVLHCGSNQFTSLPTLPTNLKYIHFDDNKLSGAITLLDRPQLVTLDVMDNPSLTGVTLARNSAFTTLHIERCTALKTLVMQNLSSFNFSSLTIPSTIEYFDCGFNTLTTLPTLPAGLVTLYCNNNKFTSLNITGKSALKALYAQNNTSLTSLSCNGNALTTLDVSGCTDLSYLDCNNNKLASLDVRGLKKLATLHAHNNVMTSFYATYCTALNELWVCRNNLTSLDLTGCTSLNVLWIMNNQIKGAAMPSLINTLRTIPTSESEGELGVFEHSYMSWPEGNQITNAQNMAARAKRWIPKQYNHNWYEIPLKGDVNGDGKINVSDVTALVNMILGTIPKDPDRGDINGDGNVNVSDVTALVNIILGSSN